MTMRKLFLLLSFAGTMAFLEACDRQEFLDEKPQTSLLVPTTLADFQKLLDNVDMNVSGILGEVSSDDYYLKDLETWESLSLPGRNAYIWAKDLYEGKENINDWNYPYEQILYANIVLEGLDKLGQDGEGTVDYERIKGWALFLRGHAYFNLVQHFAAPYDDNTAADLLGVPIRMEADVTVKSNRASLQQTYDRLLADLIEAERLLPDKAPGVDRNRPYKPAANALLARVYLSMRRYNKALLYAERSLQLYNTLIDYNTIDTTARTPFTVLNDEKLFACNPARYGSGIIETYRTAPNTIIDSVLYSYYDTDDLRKIIFYKISETHGEPVYKGSYAATVQAFSGLATDEQYLIKAECQIRAGDVEEGMKTLNALLATRWKTGTFVPFSMGNKEDALALVLKERRKELVFRGLRWQDLRRLNIEGANIVLTRMLNGISYQLPANSPLYILPIPPDEIHLSGLQQNPR